MTTAHPITITALPEEESYGPGYPTWRVTFAGQQFTAMAYPEQRRWVLRGSRPGDAPSSWFLDQFARLLGERISSARDTYPGVMAPLDDAVLLLRASAELRDLDPNVAGRTEVTPLGILVQNGDPRLMREFSDEEITATLELVADRLTPEWAHGAIGQAVRDVEGGR